MTEEQRWPEPVYLTKDHAINMTLRDYFAAKAMQAMRKSDTEDMLSARELATLAYQDADAMLKEREKNT
jgi:hypothetical protein